jgi:hypothetical protein
LPQSVSQQATGKRNGQGNRDNEDQLQFRIHAAEFTKSSFPSITE